MATLAAMTESELDRAHDEGPTCAAPTPGDLTLFAPLLARLALPHPPTEALRFPRGTLLPDGRLDLCKQGVGPDGAWAVARALAANPYVTSVMMGADHLGPEGALALAAAAAAPAVDTLYLGCNAVGVEGARALADAVIAQDRIRALWIKRNELGPGGAAELARMLREARGLRTLDAVSNELGPDGVAALCAAAAVSPSPLETLFLCGNRAGVDGARRLADLIARRPSLRAVFFAGNAVGDEGARLLAAALRHAPGLRVLGLSSNDIGPDGARALALALRDHPGLRALELGAVRAADVLGVAPNRLGDEGAAALADALRVNRTLQSLDLRGSGVGPEGAAALVGAVRDHPAMADLLLDASVPVALRAQLVVRVANNRNARVRTADDLAFEDSLRAVRSVYRAGAASPAPVVAPSALRWPDAESVARAIETLRAVEALPAAH
ncbi:MAG: gala protein, partial [Myxococcaceae bacterium]|nr:gala protein [Myxococcaceae bacterium]